MLLGLFSTNASAQLKEVRGVQTRSVKYTEYIEGEKVERRGYELKNENDYDVWLELELKTSGYDYTYWDKYDASYKKGKVIAGVKDTKNITLKAGETYVWKCGDRMLECPNAFYVEYKAYKKE